jgi:hypothetical protein
MILTSLTDPNISLINTHTHAHTNAHTHTHKHTHTHTHSLIQTLTCLQQGYSKRLRGVRVNEG